MNAKQHALGRSELYGTCPICKAEFGTPCQRPGMDWRRPWHGGPYGKQRYAHNGRPDVDPLLVAMWQAVHGEKAVSLPLRIGNKCPRCGVDAGEPCIRVVIKPIGTPMHDRVYHYQRLILTNPLEIAVALAARENGNS